jgi:hypothetical protein
VISALHKAKKLAPNCYLVIITSQAPYPLSPSTFKTMLKASKLTPASRRPLRVISALHNAKKLAHNCHLVIITSQAGSVEWREIQNANAGGDYGHHMSRAACNMAGEYNRRDGREGLVRGG